MEMSGHLHPKATSPHGNSPQYPMCRRLCGPQSWSKHFNKNKNPQPSQKSNPSHPTHRQSLYWQLFRIMMTKMFLQILQTFGVMHRRWIPMVGHPVSRQCTVKF